MAVNQKFSGRRARHDQRSTVALEMRSLFARRLRADSVIVLLANRFIGRRNRTRPTRPFKLDRKTPNCRQLGPEVPLWEITPAAQRFVFQYGTSLTRR
jgi:hypothetical protein